MSGRVAAERQFPSPAEAAAESPFLYDHSLSVPDVLLELKCTLVISTYQAGKLALFRPQTGRLSLLLRSFQQAMGVAVSHEAIAVGTRHLIWTLEANAELSRTFRPSACHDGCFLPRRAHVTGNIDVHELAWGLRATAGKQQRSMSDVGRVSEDGATGHDEPQELWVVNTLFSALCTLHPHYSFVPQWRPPFVTALAPEDRCHLNGLAMFNGRPGFATAFAETDSLEGWRSAKRTGGCVLDVASGETITRGLMMPHSPRIWGGALYLLESGQGGLVQVDLKHPHCETVVRLPGYTRGLAIHGNYAFIGLSRVRDGTVLGDVPLAENIAELKCGVWVVNLASGQVEGHVEFPQGVTEIFDVQLLPGMLNPHVIGLEKDDIHKIFVLPREARP